MPQTEEILLAQTSIHCKHFNKHKSMHYKHFNKHKKITQKYKVYLFTRTFLEFENLSMCTSKHGPRNRHQSAPKAKPDNLPSRRLNTWQGFPRTWQHCNLAILDLKVQVNRINNEQKYKQFGQKKFKILNKFQFT